MLITAIELPSPRIIKKKLKKYMNAERITIYSLASIGIIVVCFNSVPVKILPIASLIYCTVAYEIIQKSEGFIEDPELIKLIMEDPMFTNQWHL